MFHRTKLMRSCHTKSPAREVLHKAHRLVARKSCCFVTETTFQPLMDYPLETVVAKDEIKTGLELRVYANPVEVS